MCEVPTVHGVLSRLRPPSLAHHDALQAKLPDTRGSRSPGVPSPSQHPLSDIPCLCHRDEGLVLRPVEAQPAKPKGELPPSHRGRILLPAAAQGSGTDLTAGENHLFPVTG